MLVFEERGKREYPEKTSRCRIDNQLTQPTYDAESGNRTRATLVGGECSHHCAHPCTPALSNIHPVNNIVIKRRHCIFFDGGDSEYSEKIRVFLCRSRTEPSSFRWRVPLLYQWAIGDSSVVTRGYSENPSFPSEESNRPYELPITSLDALPMSYWSLVGARPFNILKFRARLFKSRH